MTSNPQKIVAKTWREYAVRIQNQKLGSESYYSNMDTDIEKTPMLYLNSLISSFPSIILQYSYMDASSITTVNANLHIHQKVAQNSGYLNFRKTKSAIPMSYANWSSKMYE